MRCPSCNHENRPERRFCAECGATLAAACGACGAMNERGEKFCGGCGARLISAARAARGGSPVFADGPIEVKPLAGTVAWEAAGQMPKDLARHVALQTPDDLGRSWGR